MKKFLISIYKEGILVIRDIEGVLILFIMPMILVVVVSLLEEKSFHSISDKKIPVVIIDCDQDKLGKTLIKGITDSDMFEITTVSGCDSSIINEVKKNVAKGIFQIGIHIPKNSTQTIKDRGLSLMQQLVQGENMKSMIN